MSTDDLSTDDRHLAWDGCVNARDLGGLPTADGRTIRRGAVVRSDNPAYLSTSGWAALHAHGVRTIVALRTIGQVDDEPDAALVPPDVVIDRVVIEDGTDPEFVARCVDGFLFGTPIYFGLMLEHWPDRCAGAVRAVATAAPGGVVISCGRGCDRTGLLAFLLLALAGVDADTIAADWALSVERLRPRDPDYERVLTEILEREQATVVGAMHDALDRFDVAQRLIDGGLEVDAIDAVRTRLVDAVPTGVLDGGR